MISRPVRNCTKGGIGRRTNERGDSRRIFAAETSRFRRGVHQNGGGCAAVSAYHCLTIFDHSFPDLEHRANLPILHPHVAGQRATLAGLREELCRLFQQRHELADEIVPRLRDRWHELFGRIERTMQERSLELRERERMMELFALKIERGQPLDRQTVALTVRAVQSEFARVRERMGLAQSAERRREHNRSWRPSPTAPDSQHRPAASPRESGAELRELYRKLARRLHPDTATPVAREQSHLWMLLQRARTAGDLALLRSLAALSHTLSDEAASAGLEDEIDRLRRAVEREREAVREIVESELYRRREQMDDPDWIERQRAALEVELAEVERGLARCAEFLDPILGDEPIPPPAHLRSLWANFVEEMYINNR